MIEFLVAGLFSDHMVLQQQRANPVWGCDKPGQVVRLTVEGTQGAPMQVQVTTDGEGKWKLYCPVLPAGGPYRLTVDGSGKQVIDDVLVGEVWLASGQSNMAWTLGATDTGPQDVQAANHPNIRSIKIPNYATREPQSVVGGEWTVCSPATAGGYSAIAYHYAAKLHQQLGVPVGIIDSSWGGSRIEAWTSEAALAKVMDLKAELDSLQGAWEKLPSLKLEFGKRVSEWEAKAFPADPGNTGEGLGWASRAFDDSAWSPISAPGAWERQGFEGPGVIWYRVSINIPASWTGDELQLDLGAIDDFDDTYFNGVKVGSHPKGTPKASSLRRSYTVPASAVKEGRALIAIRVFDQNGGGGLQGPAALMGLRNKTKPEQARITLVGDWRAHREASVTVGEVDWSTNPWPEYPEEQYWPATIFNGMISPLLGYGMRGVIWYQGETNCDSVPETYGVRFNALIRDWRARWGQGDFDFYFVQLPNFHSNEGWPIVRQGQASALQSPRTGMVVALDAGNPNDIHPRSKTVVAGRLANLALVRTYGVQNLVCSGPVRESVDISASGICIHFLNAQGLRTRDGATLVTGFEVAGSDGVYHAATGRIEGETVLLSCAEVATPLLVRYAWTSCPETNLENGAGLPAAPFSM